MSEITYKAYRDGVMIEEGLLEAKYKHTGLTASKQYNFQFSQVADGVEGDLSPESLITTLDQLPTGLTVTPKTKSLIVGATHQIAPTVTPANAKDKSVTYVSGTPANATVSATGLVTAVNAGTSIITVKPKVGTGSDTVTITVTAE